MFDMWVSYFGMPGKILTDNGSEFGNDELMEMNEKLNTETQTSEGYSTFSNGIVERHNRTLFETMLKTIDDSKCEPAVALSWACSAKNALCNQEGLSPNQLVFGQNVNMP